MVRLQRRHVRTGLVGLVAVAASLLPGTPVSMAAVQPVDHAVVRGVCHGGGFSSMSVRRVDADNFEVSVHAHGLRNGERWKVYITEGSYTSGDAVLEAPQRAKVVDRQISVLASLTALEDPYFDVIANGPGRFDGGGDNCQLLLSSQRPFAALTNCRKSFMPVMAASYRAGVGIVVRWAVFGARPGSRLHVDIVARTSALTQGTADVGRANRDGVLRGRSVFDNGRTPRLVLDVIADGGQRCSLAMDRSYVLPTGMAKEALTELRLDHQATMSHRLMER